VLEKLLTQKESQLNNLDNYSNKLLVQEHNYNELIEKIDELDIEWINISCNWERGLFKWMFLNTKEKWLFEVNWIEKDIWKITLITLNDKWNYEPQTYDYFQFYEAFKDNETKRLKNISDFWELIDIKSTDNDNWKNHKIDNWKLMATNVVDWSEKKDMEVNYLVSDESDTIVRINEFSGNHVKIQFWERKENKNLTDKEKKWLKFQKDDKGNVIWETLLIKGAQEYSISLNQLDLLIKEYKFYPNWQTWKTEKEKVLEPETEFGTSFFSKLFSLSSVSEVLAGWKMVIDSIWESLKKWNDLHSAKAALVMWWAFLPEELKQELQIKVERAESESMDKELESLWKVDSRIAVKRIEKWLLNKDTPEYKKEAWILFMLEKYWHLTSKGALYPHRWKFLWYEAFGWSVWDDFFNRIKKESFDQDITFSEEFLMLILLKQQCKGNFLWHRRRSRLHKEFDAKWSRWISEEVEKWYKDASLKRNARTMVDEWLDAEVAGWTTSNGIWWFKKAIERWWSLEDMSEWFFCMLYSWVLFDVDQKTFMNIKALWDGWMPIIMTRYSTKLSDMKLFNKTVLELSLRMWDIYWNKMWEEAQKLFTATENKTWNEEDRVKDAQKFWKKYWTPLSRALNFANTKDNTYSKTDNIIFLEKENNDTFAEYYKSTKWFVSEITFDKDLMDDACWEVWITGLNVIGLTKKYLKIWNHRQLTEPKTWARVWKEIIKDMKSVRTKDISEIDKKRYLLNTLKDLTSWFLSNLAGWNLEIYNYPSTNIWKALNKMKLFIWKDLWGFSPDWILDWEADRVLWKVVNNILAWALEWWDSDIYVNPLEEISAPIKKEANNILEQDSWMFGETI